MNKVIIVGNDHVNTLGVIRTFGENGIKPYVVVISDINVVSVIKSKYVEQYFICQTEEIALLTIMTKFFDENDKPVIIPTTDSMAYQIDEKYSLLSKKFIISSISQKSGEIIKYMDKYNQYNIIVKNKLKMAKSFILNINEINDKYKYPCILKPLISAEGKKDDIIICKNNNDFISAINRLKQLNYKKILLQDFINYDYEVDIAGFSYDRQVSIPGVIEKVRIWPPKKGSTTYGKVVPTSKYEKLVNSIEMMIKKLDYNGIFDIDCFVCGEEFYINEINFRNGALSYGYGDAYICYNWYLSNINNKFTPAAIINFDYYFMDDQADLHNIIDKTISYKIYKENKAEAKVLLGDNKIDIKVSKIMKRNKMLNKFKINKIRNYFNKIYHKDVNGYILMCNYSNLKKEHFNSDYKVVTLDIDNYMDIMNLEKRDSALEKLLNDNTMVGIAFVNNIEELICYGFIKFKGNDRFFKITKRHSGILTHLIVNNDFRGKKYQCDLINELIDIARKKYKLSCFYAFVYEYNIPSYKNFYRIGFEKIGEKAIIRFFKNTLNKERI